MTREELKQKITSHEGDMNTLKSKMLSIVDETYDKIEVLEGTVDDLSDAALKVGGTGTAAEIAALTDPAKNAVYRVITTGGNLNSGGDQITVAVRDLVYHNGTKWVLLVDADA